MNTFYNVNDLLPPFDVIVELESNGNIFRGSLFDYVRSEKVVRWLIDNTDKIEFSTAKYWRFIQ